MLKLYCHADETGQDAIASFFLVSIMVSDKGKVEKLGDKLLEMESKTKGKSKWVNAKDDKKVTFIHELAKIKELKQDLFYSVYKGGGIYTPLVALAVGKAIIYKVKNIKNYSVNIIIDGLNKVDKEVVRKELKSLNIKYRKIKTNLKDEQDVFLRLVDAMAGFIRDYLEKEKYAVELFKEHNLTRFFMQI
ncbi:MAG: hypothetical protein ABIJ60_02470 [Patescibacteria group bacterium]